MSTPTPDDIANDLAKVDIDKSSGAEPTAADSTPTPAPAPAPAADAPAPAPEPAVDTAAATSAPAAEASSTGDAKLPEPPAVASDVAASAVPPAAPAADAAPVADPPAIQEVVIDASAPVQASAQPIEERKKSHLRSGHFFRELESLLDPNIFRGLVEMGVNEMSQIQFESLPPILQKNSCIAQAQSGSGKTIAFCLGALSALDSKINEPQVIIMAPTHELVHQTIRDTLSHLVRHIQPPPVTVCAIGRTQLERNFRIKAQIIVGTPGSIRSLIMNGNLQPSTIRVVAIDEADFMLENSEGSSCKDVAVACNAPNCQKLFFSATYTKTVYKLAEKIVMGPPLARPGSSVAPPKEPVVIRIPRQQLKLDEIAQMILDCRNYSSGRTMKLDVLAEIYSTSMDQSIIFVESKRECNAVAEKLAELQLPVSALHGDLQGYERQNAMERFIKMKTRILVTTNVLARGINVPTVKMVINYNVPICYPERIVDPHLYIHRIGRTARFGRPGLAINLVEHNDEIAKYQEIETLIDPRAENNPEAQFMERFNRPLAEIEAFFRERVAKYSEPSNNSRGFDADAEDEIDIVKELAKKK